MIKWYGKKRQQNFYEYFCATEKPEECVIKISESDEGIMTLDGNPPKSYHSLEKEDYSYKGSVNGRIYTLKYFDTTADGKIYIEDFAKNHNINDKKYVARCCYWDI